MGESDGLREHFRDITVLAPQNDNQYVKLRFEFSKGRLIISTKAGRGEKGEKDSLEFIEDLRSMLKKDGTAHNVYRKDYGRTTRVDGIGIPLMPVPIAYRYVSMNAQGKEVRGTVTAMTASEAISKLRDMGYFPTKVEKKKP